MLMLAASAFRCNYARIAGGAVFPSHRANTLLACRPVSSVAFVTAPLLSCGGPAWKYNAVSPNKSTTSHVLGTSLLGYGPDTAFQPAKIMLSNMEVESYVSNGIYNLPLNISVQDERGSRTTTGVTQTTVAVVLHL